MTKSRFLRTYFFFNIVLLPFIKVKSRIKDYKKDCLGKSNDIHWSQKQCFWFKKQLYKIATKKNNNNLWVQVIWEERGSVAVAVAVGVLDM